MKKVLIITFSQSGQLDEIVSNITDQFPEDIQLHYEKLKPIPSFNFPWKGTTFYDAMPESVRMIPAKLEPLSFNPNEDFDLIILGYPIWFLSSPIPITTFLKSKEAKMVMKGKPIITVIGARNMWVTAQEDIKKMIKDNGGIHRGNIALHDKHSNLSSVITIVYWMGTGNKDRYLGIFPKPGISDSDIKNAERFAPVIVEALVKNEFFNLHENLLNLKAVELSANVISTEEKGKRMFHIWSGFILKKGGPGSQSRVFRLIMFKWYLLFVIFAVSPIVTFLFYVTWPLFFLRIRKKLKYYSGVELSN
ncbi:MAG: dialkylresorcinol condensing enzyme DarA [Bacteroidota bacterium]